MIDPRYDITITDEGVTKGFMLARADALGRGARRWQTQALATPIAQATGAEQRYGNQPATVDLPMVFRSTHKGYGDEQVRGEGRYHYSLNVDGRFPNQVIAGPEVFTLTLDMSSTPLAFFEQNGQVFVVGGRYCKAIDTSFSITTARDFGEGKAATQAAIFNGKAYVAMGYDEPFWERSPNSDPTQGWSQATALYAKYFVTMTDRLYAAVTKSSVKSVANDPMTAIDWTAAYPIGDPDQEITCLAQLGDLLYVGKQNGLYALDSDGIADLLTPELGEFAHTYNCANTYAWHATLWVPHLRGLLNYRNLGEGGFVVTPTTPGSFTTEENPIRGRVTALAGDDRWLYAAVLNSDGDTYILAGRAAFEGEQGPLTWHPLVKLAGVECRAMHISGLWANPRLFFGMGTNAGYIILPRTGENPAQDSNCRFSTTGSLYYPAHSWYAPTTHKVWRQVEIKADNLTASRYIDVYYRIDWGSWTYAGRANRSPQSVVPFPVGGVSGVWLEIRLDFVLPSDTKTAIVRDVVIRGAERPSPVTLIQAAIRCADNLPLKSGRDRRTGAQIFNDLQAYTTLNRSVTLTDTLGVERRVLVLAPIREQEIAQYDDHAPERVAIVQMAVFEASQLEAEPPAYGVYGTSKYGGGDVYA